VFYSRLEGPRVSQYGDLVGKTIAVVRGAVYFDPFDADSSLLKEAVSDYESAFRKVAAGRNDFVIAPELQGDYLLKELHLPLVKGPFRIEGRPSHIVLSKRSPVVSLQSKIEAAMRTLQSDGTWDRILARYR